MRTPLRAQPRLTHHSERGLVLIIVAFLAMAAAHIVIIPPYENLDELEHAEVVRHIAVTGRLPVHDDADAKGFHVRQEASQPPLYHILAAAVSRLWSLPTNPHAPTPVPGNVVACGLTGTGYNKTTFIHDPYRVEGDQPPAHITIRVLRALSTTLQLATLAGVWTLSRRVFPTDPVAMMATGIVAFNPQLLLLAAGVNNDNAVIPLVTWGLVLAFDLWDRELSWPRSLLFGAIGGLAALSKLSGAAVLGVGGLALLARLLQKRSSISAIVTHGVAMTIVAAVLVAPWMLRNATLYGDPTALTPMLAKVGTRDAPIALGEARLMTLSFWGQLPCAFYARALYWPYLLLMAGGLVGVLGSWRQLTTRQRAMIAMCSLWFLVIVLAWIRWDTMTAATGGRLLFPAIAALAVILATGWYAWGKRLARLWAAALPVWSIVVLIAGPLAIFAPPNLAPPGHRPAVQDEATFGNEISLQSYAARVTTTPGRCLFTSSAYCGPVLELSLGWQARSAIDEDLTLVIQLVSAAPGATDLRLNYNHWPGRGNLPTSKWPVGPIIEDHYWLPVPPSEVETQAWRVTLAYVDPASDTRLPVAADDEEIGDSLTLAHLRVPGRPPETNSIAALPAAVAYSTGEVSDALRLVGAQVHPGDEGTWTVDLLWECAREVSVDAVTFVHAYDAAGHLLTTGDASPKQGAFPTSLWEPGDRILSRHTLALDAAPTPASVAVGLYLADTGLRLPATLEGDPVPNDAYVAWRGDP
ncbi:MAG: hypothetical protein JXC32_07580 [Anaerolineae bacterium]|nr:hypothetical protein [Anaerolineae bacterium]